MAEKRRKKGEGHWKVTKAGNIEYRFRYTDEYGRRKYKSVTGINEDHCHEKAEQFLARLEEIKNGRDLNATIVSLVREKIDTDYKKNFTGEQGYDRNLQTLAIIERGPIGHIPICDMQPYHIEGFYRELTKYANNTISKVYSMMKTAFKMAVQKKIITYNIMEDRNLRCPKSDKVDKKVRGLTDEEQKRFVSALNAHTPKYGANTYKLQLLIALYSGLRMGEVNALKPEDINFRQGFIHVCRTISVGINNRAFVKDGTKTIAGERDVPISKPLENVLRQALDEMKDNPEGLIFYDCKRKKIVNTAQVNSFYKTICKRAEILCNGQHALRHTFATRCIEAGVPALVLKNWLGHTDIHITLDTYADVFDRMNLGAISKFEKLMDEVMAEEQ